MDGRVSRNAPRFFLGLTFGCDFFFFQQNDPAALEFFYKWLRFLRLPQLPPFPPPAAVRQRQAISTA